MTSDKNNITKFLKSSFTILLLLLSICWISYILMQEREEIIIFYKNITIKSLLYLCLSIIIGAISVFQYIIILKEIVHRQFGKHLSIKYLSALFFRSQIIKYLPGRFLGIVYQAVKSKGKIPASIIIKSNIELMMFNIVFHFLTSILLIIICNGYYFWGGIGFLILIAVIYYYLSLDLFFRIIQLGHKIIPKKWENVKKSVSTQNKYTKESIVKILFAYLTSWILYILAWIMFTKVFPALTVQTSILICATYTLSWIIGFVSMLTPAGLGIREGAFIYLSSLLMIINNVAFLAVFLRVWLIIIDLLLVLVSIIMNLYRTNKPITN